MAEFNLCQYLADCGVNVDTDSRMEIEHVNFDLIVPDPNNFYELSDLDELAASIACVGLQQPLLVRPMEGDDSQVIITSGHRRHAALKMLIEQDGRDDLRDIPCIIAPADENPKLTQLKLILANSTARKLSSADLANQAEQLEQLLYELKEDGMEFPGRMRDYVARACNVSTGKLARLKQIRSGLIPDLLSRWERGELTDERAANIAKASPEMQEAIAKSLAAPKSAPATVQYTAASDPLPLSPYKEYVDAAIEREQERLRAQIGNAILFVVKNPDLLHRYLSHAVCRNDIVKHIKEECARHSNLWGSDIQYAFERNYVRVGSRGEVMQEYTHTEFADALLIAAARLHLDKAQSNPAPHPAPELTCWNTGDPPRPGYYVCRFLLDGETEPMWSEFWWGGKKWTKLTGMENITHWMPSPEDA